MPLCPFWKLPDNTCRAEGGRSKTKLTDLVWFSSACQPFPARITKQNHTVYPVSLTLKEAFLLKGNVLGQMRAHTDPHLDYHYRHPFLFPSPPRLPSTRTPPTFTFLLCFVMLCASPGLVCAHVMLFVRTR